MIRSIGIVLHYLNVGYPCRCLLAFLDALARGHAEEVGNAPDDVILHFASFAIGINDVPQDTDQLQTLFGIEVTLEIGGEAVVVDCGTFCFEPGGDESVELFAVERILLLQQLAQPPLLAILYL
jgi:hypothetical protein